MKTATPGLPPGADAETEALIKEARRRQHRRYLLTGLAAAVVLAAAGIMVSQLQQGSQPRAHAVLGVSLAGTPARYARAPAYYAYTVQGDIYNYVSHGTQYGMSAERYLKIRATATGKLLATIGPPRPYNAVGPLTADADGRTFVFGAQRIWERNAGPSPKLAERDRRTPMKFLLLHITPQGHLQRAVLSLPDTMTPMQRPSIALSPDGTRLAVAFGGRGHTAAIQVITLTTGQVRQWIQPDSPWAPLLNGKGAWTADGQTLAFEQQLIPPHPLKRYTVPATTEVRLLDITARGTSLAASKLLVLRPPAGESPPAQPFLTPDGTTLIGPVGSKRFLETPNHPSTGQLAAYSARTGALLRTLAPWVWRWPSPPGRGGNPNQTIAWSNRSGSQLIILQPRDDLNILGTLTRNTFTQTASKLLPQQPQGYQELQYALRIAPLMAW
jgi:hypothetical protein